MKKLLGVIIDVLLVGALVYVVYMAADQAWTARLQQEYWHGYDDSSTRCYLAHGKRLGEEDPRSRRHSTAVKPALNVKIPRP